MASMSTPMTVMAASAVAKAIVFPPQPQNQSITVRSGCALAAKESMHSLAVYSAATGTSIIAISNDKL